MNVTVKFGVGNSTAVDYDEGTTVDELLNDQDLRATLGFGSNVHVLVNDEPVSAGYELEEGDVVIIEQMASKKAVR